MRCNCSNEYVAKQVLPDVVSWSAAFDWVASTSEHRSQVNRLPECMRVWCAFSWAAVLKPALHAFSIGPRGISWDTVTVHTNGRNPSCTDLVCCWSVLCFLKVIPHPSTLHRNFSLPSCAATCLCKRVPVAKTLEQPDQLQT